jgi:signal transduction histidine kinase
MKRSLSRRRNEQADFGEQISKLVADATTTAELYTQILKFTGEAIASTSQSLFLCDQPGNQLREVANNGVKADLIDFVPFDLGSGLSAWVGQEKRVVRVSRSHRRSKPAATFMAAPLLVNGQLVGVLALSDSRRDSFTDGELAAAETLGTQIAVGLERRLYQERLTASTDRADRAQERLAAMAGELEATKHELAKQVHALTLLERAIAPLSTIRHTAEFLIAHLDTGDPKVQGRLETIHTECSRARQMLDKVQQLSGQAGTFVGSSATSATTSGVS